VLRALPAEREHDRAIGTRDRRAAAIVGRSQRESGARADTSSR
jgi:hypothetical protein